MRKFIIWIILSVDIIFVIFLSIAISQKIKMPNIQSQTTKLPLISSVKPPDNTKQPPIEDKKPVDEFRNILFQYRNSKAVKVFLVGDFNNWKKITADQFKKNYKNNNWELIKKIKPGKYLYKYCVDNKLIKDPNNFKSENGNSLLMVKPKNK